MSISRPSKIAIPEGFASLTDAKRWEDGLKRAEEALDSLWLQRTIYVLEEALACPGMSSLAIYASIELPGIECVALVETRHGPRELGALLVGLFKGGCESEGITEMGVAMERLRAALREVERWTRDRQTLIREAKSLGPTAERNPVKLSPGMDWRSVAEAIGAGEAAMMMEKAQISKAARDSGKAGKSTRI